MCTQTVLFVRISPNTPTVQTASIFSKKIIVCESRWVLMCSAQTSCIMQTRYRTTKNEKKCLWGCIFRYRTFALQHASSTWYASPVHTLAFHARPQREAKNCHRGRLWHTAPLSHLQAVSAVGCVFIAIVSQSEGHDRTQQC